MLLKSCEQCGADIIAPEWSEYLSTGCVRNVWTCEACGHDFEDSVCFYGPAHPTRQANAAGNHP